MNDCNVRGRLKSPELINGARRKRREIVNVATPRGLVVAATNFCRFARRLTSDRGAEIAARRRASGIAR